MKINILPQLYILFILSINVFCFGQDNERYWQSHIIDNSSKGADGVRLLDVNGDGLADVVTGWEQGGITRIYFHPGYEKVTEVWKYVTVGKTPSVEDAVFVDLDGDGNDDVVSSTEGNSRRVFFHWAPKNKNDYTNSEKWKTEILPIAEQLTSWMYCLPLQIDGQNGIDLVIGGKFRSDNKTAKAVLGWFRSPENPRDLSAWTWHPLTEPIKWIMALRKKDMDGDGAVDIIVTDRDECFWLRNPGTKIPDTITKHWERITLHAREPLEFPKPFETISTEEQTVMFGNFADLDQDSLEDFVVAITPKILLWLRRLDTSGRHWEKYPITYVADTGSAKGVAEGDVNQDGKPDLVLFCGGAAEQKQGGIWLSYDKSPKEPIWKPHILSGPNGKKFDDVYLYDFNGDGKLDAITTEEQGGSQGNGLGVIWYENPF
ncbi:MAG: VCBS repeat-containing protein [Planctomycetaceae bacterium]|jgi:hypothetical protein|nr:VCBS repeat-containing protein [Planctomycetaceae bacterium]